MALAVPYSTTTCPCACLRSRTIRLIRPHRAADDVVVEQAVENVPLPLRAGDVGPEREFGRSAGQVDPIVKRRGEVAERPEVLSIRRLVEQPGGRPSRPATAFEVDLVVQKSLENCVLPPLRVQMTGKLPRSLDKRRPISRLECVVGPVLAVIIPFRSGVGQFSKRGR